jgi:trimeric autotransporter adhesin
MKLYIIAALLPMLAYSQTFQGSLRGRVVDPAGAIASSVQVTLIDEATSLTRATISNQQGEYVFNSVQPATYTVSAEATGFKRLDRKGVLVATQNAVTLDLTLEIGQVSEQITVTDVAPQLQTADASIGQVIDSRKITDLPNLGRNPFFVAKLSQSVVFVANPKMGRMQDQNANSAVSIAGGPLRSNNTLVDGVSITDANNRAVILPSPEAVQELKLQTATYDAEAGRTGGGTFNTVLRSGTNQLHGSAVGYLRQNQWTANTFFANRVGNPVPKQPFKQFAGSLGGPISIPKLYDGRNRSFFFISTEAYRQLDASTVNQSVPTALERVGDFSQTRNRTNTLQTIYDPLTTTSAGVRTAFVGNVIPLSRLDPIGTKLAAYYPTANSATPYYGAPNYTYTGNFPNRGDQSIWKADHQFAPWLRASGSYIYQKTGETGSPLSWGNVASPGQNLLFRRINATQANATITPSPTVVIAVRWGFNRFFSTSGPTLSSGFSIASLGLPQSLADQTVEPAFPAITMGTLTSFGGGTRSRDVYYSRTAGATISKFLGKHSLKGGFDFRTLHDAATPAVGPTGLGFTDVFTRPNPTAATTGQGSDLATMLLGYPTSGSQNVVSNFDNYVRYYGVFFQDDYRFSSKLTFNIGLRLEYESGVRELGNRLIVGFDPSTSNPLQQNISDLKLNGVVQYAGVNGNPTQTGSPRAIKPGPRFGFAYSPNAKTAIRGGYGISWAPTFFNYQNTIGYSQTTTLVASTNNNFTPAATLTNPYPNGLLQITGNAAGGLSGIGQGITVPDKKTRSAGYVQQFSLEVQRELPGSLVLTVGALGSHSIGLLSQGVNINQLNPTYFGYGAVLNQSVANPMFNKGGVGTVGTATISRNQLWRPFPQFTSVALSNLGRADARYYSFYVRGERRYSNGLSLLASYTRSRSLDNVLGQSLPGTTSVTSAGGAQNAYDLNAEFGLSTQDVPNRFTAAITYELPVGRGKTFLRNSRVLDWVVGGWSINTTNTIQSGFPLAITQANNNSTIGASSQRPNATGISPETSGSVTRRIDGWLNPAAFSSAPQFTFGNLSRFANVRGPGLYNWDASIFKTFAIKERIKAQFRAEAINATNTPYFGNPNTTTTDNQFGLVTTQINYPRLIQFGVRVTF